VKNDLEARVAQRLVEWAVREERRLETETSVIVLGSREGVPVVLKIARQNGDEWRGGEIAAAFGGRGSVQVHEHADGAVLLERLSPGTPLADLALSGRDDEATEILAIVLGKMSPADPPPTCATIEAWGFAFERHLASGDRRVPCDLVQHAQRVYAELAASQRNPSLLHGDLHHYNVLLDKERSWLAVDPKGVVGELEYEIGAAMRNPWERPELAASPDTIERRLARFRDALGIDVDRARAWSFAQGVLSAIWSVEDGKSADDRHPGLAVARAIRQAPAFRADFPA
jgi:streptomycin 6-kinase